MRPVGANKLAQKGEYAQARAMFESADITTDQTTAMLYIMLLDRMDEQAAKQAVVAQLTSGLADMGDYSDTYLTFLLRQAQRACLPDAAIHALLDAADARGATEGDLAMVHRAVQHRASFRTRLAGRVDKYRFISLGANCLPWTMLNRWGLRDQAQFIEDFNPFSLATHKVQGVVNALRDDFATYLDPDELVIETGKSGQPNAMRRDKLAHWNHNQSNYWITDDYANLRANIERKIENFRRSCKAEHPVFIVTGPFVSRQERLPIYLRRLRRVLEKFTGTADSYIVFTSQALKVGQQPMLHMDERAVMFHTPYPSEDYVWFDMNVADADAGLAFEREYMNGLFGALHAIGLTDALAGDA